VGLAVGLAVGLVAGLVAGLVTEVAGGGVDVGGEGEGDAGVWIGADLVAFFVLVLDRIDESS
jgi:hypothetical protein